MTVLYLREAQIGLLVIFYVSLIRKGCEVMLWTIVILSVIGLAAALLIFLNIRKSFKRNDCGSCCGCDKNCKPK